MQDSSLWVQIRHQPRFFRDVVVYIHPSIHFIWLGANHQLGDNDIEIDFWWRMGGQRHRAQPEEGDANCTGIGDDGTIVDNGQGFEKLRGCLLMIDTGCCA